MTRVFSGIQPSGEMHLGNYLGAVARWVEHQDEADALYCVVDLHVMTVPFEPAELTEATERLAMLLLSAGLDPGRCILFVQSHVPLVTELTWILNCVATVGELRRMTQFKEKGGGQESVSAGLLDYPVLMAADIVLYDTDEVPVGDDQTQHVELAHDIAIRFNHRFGETLVVPKATMPQFGARVKDLQRPEAKMSKSIDSPQGTIGVLDPPEVITKKVRSAVTDSGAEVRFAPAEKPGVSNLLAIYAAATGVSVERAESEFAGSQYGAFKTAVADSVVELLAPVRLRYEELAADRGEVARILADGAAKATTIAGTTMERVRRATGLLAPRH